jgi:hypothetical protein
MVSVLGDVVVPKHMVAPEILLETLKLLRVPTEVIPVCGPAVRVPVNDVADNVPIPLILVLTSSTNALEADAVPGVIEVRYPAFVLVNVDVPTIILVVVIDDIPDVIAELEFSIKALDADAVPGVIPVRYEISDSTPPI